MRPLYRLLLLSLFLAQATSAFGQLCPGVTDPCVISTSQTIPSGTVLDIGSRGLVIASGTALTVNGPGVFTINSLNLTLGENAKILASGQEGFGGSVLILSSGLVTLEAGSRIDVQAAFGGDISLTGHAVQMNGQLKASATSRDGDGGLIDITTTLGTTIGGLGMQANGGDRFSSGGFIDVIADGDILVDALIEAKGGDGDGGDIDLDGLGNVTTTINGELNTIATEVFGSGGFTTITGGGSVTIGGLIFSRGQGDYLEGGGDGGDLDITADAGDVVINGRIEIDGSAPDGSGGFMDVFATGTIFLNDDITMTGGREGGGGDLLLTADHATVDGSVDLRGGFIGGAVDVFASGDVVFTGLADIDASTDNGPFGQFGGLFDALGCDIDVQAGARILAVGNGTTPRATIRLRATNSLTIAGTMQAGALVELRVRDSLPVFVPGFIIDPTPTTVFDPALPCCINCTTTTTGIGSTTTTMPIAVCGNGIPETGEQCDDGNPFDGDCCSSSCTLDPAGTACLDDGNVCTTDTCDGAGTCAHPAGNVGALCRPQTNVCDLAEFCDGLQPACPPDGAAFDGTSCDDDACFDAQTCTDGVCGGGTPVVCPACESCDSATGCVATPQLACRQPLLPAKSSFIVKDKDPDAKDKLIWKWTKGQATDLADFGDPATTNDFALCVFDESGPAPTLLARAGMPAGGTCPEKPCWRASSSGFKYVDKERTPDGVAKMVLKAGPDGSALAVVKAKGADVMTPALPLDPPLRIQLTTAGTCWEATYSAAGIKRNDTLIFKAQSD